MNKSELSKIRAAAGRKGGLRKAENIRKKQSVIAQGSTIDRRDDLLHAIENLAVKISLLASRLENVTFNSEKPKPITQRKVEPVSDEQAKVNFWQSVAKENNVSGGAFGAILKENKELDSMFAKRDSGKT